MASFEWVFNSIFLGGILLFMGLTLLRNNFWIPFLSILLLVAMASLYLMLYLRSLLKAKSIKTASAECPTEVWNWNLQKNSILMTTLDAHPFRYFLGFPKRFSVSHFLQQFHEEDRSLITKTMEQSQQTGQDLEIEIRGSGQEKNWYILKAKLKKDRRGKPKRFLGFTIENTHRKMTENRLREVESRFRALANTISALTWMSDEKDNYVYFNRAWLEFIGDYREDDFNQNWLDFIHSEDQKLYRHDLEESLRQRKKFNAQFRLLRHDGEYRWMWYSGIPRVISDQSAHGYMGSLVDITDQLNSEKTRRQNQQTEQKLETLMKIVPVGIFQTDELGQFLYVNDQWTEMTGLDIVGSIRSNWLNAIHPDDRPDVSAKWYKLVHGSNQFEFDCRIITANRSPIWVSWKVAVLKDHRQQIIGFTGTIININSHKEIETNLIEAREKALESSRLKSTFLANMSHEIRTPLNAVIGLTGLLLKTNLDEDQLDFAQTIKVSGETLLSLINDTLDLSKIEANRLTLEKTNFNLKNWLHETIEGFNHSAKLRSLEFIEDLDLPSDLYVQADPARLRQIINNLLVNAIKFTEKGSVRVHANLNQNRTSLFFEVIDTGIGIPTIALSKMFKPFSQADNSTTRRYGGTGLGLSICAGIIDLMRGKIAVESVEKKGSRFWFEIPVEIGIADAADSIKKNEIFQIKKVNQRFLVVDDNPINQKVAVKILEKMGHYADAVANGIEAINSIEVLPYDMVLMDCQMPEMDGYEATKRIREHSRIELRKIPIVAMTANAIKGDREKCLDAGMNDYIAKPIRVDDLCGIIDNYLF